MKGAKSGKKKSSGSNWPGHLLFFVLGIVIASLAFGVLDLNQNWLEISVVGGSDSEVSSGSQSTAPALASTGAAAALGSGVDSSGNVIRSIPLVAVSEEDQTGVMGQLTVKLIPGSSDVLVNTETFLEPDLQYSANVAVDVAKNRTGISASDKDIVLSYSTESNISLVGGGSAGAASAIAIMAALENRTIKSGIAITGAINPDGSIGAVGSVFEKAKAVADAGYTTFLVPKGETKGIYYEKVTKTKQIRPGFTYHYTSYVPKTIDLVEEAEKWGLQIVEVSDIDEAAGLMLN